METTTIPATTNRTGYPKDVTDDERKPKPLD